MSQDTTNSDSLSVSFSAAEPMALSVVTEGIIATHWGDIVGTLADQTDLQSALSTINSNIATNKKNISAANSAIAENTNSIEQLTEADNALQAAIDALKPLIYAGL